MGQAVLVSVKDLTEGDAYLFEELIRDGIGIVTTVAGKDLGNIHRRRLRFCTIKQRKVVSNLQGKPENRRVICSCLPTEQCPVKELPGLADTELQDTKSGRMEFTIRRGMEDGLYFQCKTTDGKQGDFCLQIPAQST